MAAFLRRLRARVKYRNNAEELKKELEAHRALAAASFAASGDSERESRWKAARLLGNTTLAREDARAVWVARWIEQAVQDARYGVRQLIRRPSFSVTAIAMLVLGLGVTASLFTIFNSTFLQAWRLPDPGRVFVAESTWIANHRKAVRGGVSVTFSGYGLPYLAWTSIQHDAKAADYTFVEPDTFAVPFSTASGPFLRGAFVADNFFDVLRAPVQVGRGFSAATASGVPVAVISDSTWRRYFAADRGIIGKTIPLWGVATTLVGVTDRGFEGLPPDQLDVIVAASAASRWTQSPFAANLRTTDPELCCVEVSGRLRPGFSRAAAAEELTFLMRRYAADHAVRPTDVSIRSTSAIGRRGIESGPATMFALIAAGCLLVWLLSCTNVWNLELARGIERQREVSIRLSLGASRGRVVRQLLTEGLMLAAVAGILAYFAASRIPSAVMAFLSDPSPFGYPPDTSVAVFVSIFAVAATLVFSLAPALHLTRVGLRIAPITTAGGSRRVRGVVLGTQIAIGTVLVITGSLLARSVTHVLSGDADFAVGAVSLVTISPPANNPDYQDHLQLRAAWARTAATMKSEGVEFAPAMQAPIGDRKSVTTASAGNGRSFQSLIYPMASAGMSVLKIPIVAGRNYSDNAEDKEVVVNQQFAKKMWPGESALGKQVDIDYPTRGRFAVVGIARNAHITSLGDIEPLIHAPLPHSVPFMLQALVHRDAANEAAVQRVVATHEPALSVAIAPLANSVRKALRPAISGATIASALGTLALALAVVGIFGVFSFVVEERRKEIGIRLALGADRSQIGVGLIRLLAWPLGAGVGAGVVMSMAAGLTLRGYLLGISPLDPLAYMSAIVILALAAATAAFVPMRRAVSVDPAVTLRQE
jgi:predicted permease